MKRIGEITIDQESIDGFLTDNGLTVDFTNSREARIAVIDMLKGGEKVSDFHGLQLEARYDALHGMVTVVDNFGAQLGYKHVEYGVNEADALNQSLKAE